MRRLNTATLSKQPGTIFTGTLFAPELKKMIDKMNARFGTRLSVEPLENSYFGGDVSVAGLLTGQDLVKARERVRAIGGDLAVESTPGKGARLEITLTQSARAAYA